MIAGFTTIGEAYRNAQAIKMAAELYGSRRDRARWGMLRSWLTGRSQCLLDLATVEAHCKVRAGNRCARTQTVSIHSIRGSEGRCGDFDAEFRPLQSYTRQRWVGIAAARYMGRAMPAVELIQMGDLYFVRDGHHRISVAKAMGQESIEAEVTVWEVVGPLPWERTVEPKRTPPIGSLLGLFIQPQRGAPAAP